MDHRVHYKSRHQCIGLWCNIAMMDSVGEINAVEMRAIGEAYKLLARTYSRVGGLCVVRAGASMSTPDGRQEAARFAQEMGPALGLVAVVIEADGVVAQMFRSSLRAFSVFSRNPPIAVGSELEEGVNALAPIIQSPGTREQAQLELRQAFVRMRADYLPYSMG